MNIKDVLQQLKAERDRLDNAIAALEPLAGDNRRRGSGPSSAVEKMPKRRRRKMSAAARKRISDRMKARWAERRKQARKTA